MPAGCPFIRRIYALIHKTGERIPRKGERRRVSKELAEDLTIFRSFLCKGAPDTVREIPFMSSAGHDVELFADAATGPNTGFGCVFGTRCTAGFWADTNLWSLFSGGMDRPNISVLETLAIITAVLTWQDELRGKWVLLHSDNSNMVHWINKQSLPLTLPMHLLKTLFLTCLQKQIYLRALHIPGVLNITADWLSHNREDKAREHEPQLDMNMMTPSHLTWPRSWKHADFQPLK